MQGHTRGPWEWDKFACLNNGDVVICEATSIPHNPNALLIAAAPDLLEACGNALATIDEVIDGAEPSLADLEALRSHVMAAIEKATELDEVSA